VLIKGAAVRSCVIPVSSAGGAPITTLEGLATNGRLDPVQQAWIDEQVPQCGFCQNGQILTAKALLARNPAPTDAQIREGMDGVLCRCMTYYRVQAAIKRAARLIADSGARDARLVADSGARDARLVADSGARDARLVADSGARDARLVAGSGASSKGEEVA
jgi:xanthine dehydrogenase iron-sulfur cluster and FAD-binding subunit A